MNAKLTKYSIDSAEAADSAVETLRSCGPISVRHVSLTSTVRRPRRPLTTSTMQQNASSMFGFTAAETMSLAQKLYEGGSTAGQGGKRTRSKRSCP